MVSVGLDQHSTINVWDWKKGKVLATVRGHSDRVRDKRGRGHGPQCFELYQTPTDQATLVARLLVRMMTHFSFCLKMSFLPFLKQSLKSQSNCSNYGIFNKNAIRITH